MVSTLRSTTTAQVREALITRSEIALLDVREEGPFAEAHPLFAAFIGAAYANRQKRLERVEQPLFTQAEEAPAHGD